MKILIAIMMIIVFISSLFILLSVDVIARTTLDCTIENNATVCSLTGFPLPAVMALSIIVFFLIIDSFTVYIVASNIK